MNYAALTEILHEHTTHQEYIPAGLVSDILGANARTGLAEYISRLPILVIDPAWSAFQQYPTAPNSMPTPNGGRLLSISGALSDVARGAAITANIAERTKLLPPGEGFRRAARIATRNGEADFGERLNDDLRRLVATTFRQSNALVLEQSGQPKSMRITHLRARAAGIIADRDAAALKEGATLYGLPISGGSHFVASDLPKQLQSYEGVDVENLSVGRDRAVAGKLHVCADCGLGIARGAWRLTIGLQEPAPSGRDHQHFHLTCTASGFNR